MADHIQVGDAVPRVQYAANGSQTAFTFPFAIFTAADMDVWVDGVQQPTSSYSISGIGISGGGTVLFAVPPANGAVVTLRRRLAIARTGDYQEDAFIRAKVLNDELDYQTAALQQVAEDADRAVKRSFLSTNTADLKALIDDADASAQRTTLGLAAVAASGSYTDLSNKPGLGSAAALNVDTDPTLAANSDSLLPSQKAVKAYADAKMASLLSSTTFAGVESDLAQTYLLSAMAGGWSTGTLPNGAYDAFNSDTIGVNSSGQTYDTVQKLYSSMAVGSATTPITTVWQNTNIGYLQVDEQYAVANGNTVTSIGFYCDAPSNGLEVKIFLKNGPGNYTCVYSQTVNHGGTGWEDFILSAPYVVPGTGNYYIGAYPNNPIACVSTGTSAYLTSDLAQGASSSSFVERAGNGQNPISRYSYRYGPFNMTLVSSALSPTPASAPSIVKLLVLWKPVDTCTINTDFTAEATRDGSSWTAGTLSDTGLTANGFKLLWAAIDVSGQPSGTSVKYRLKALNTKSQQVKGVALIAK